MVQRTYPGSKVDSTTNKIYSFDIGSIAYDVSPRAKNGGLRLRANYLEQIRRRLVAWKQPTYVSVASHHRVMYASGVTAGATFWPSGWFTATPPTALTNRAHARFLSRVRNGQQASIGVTLGSWNQSTEMLYRRTKAMSDLADKRIEVLRGTPRSLLVRRLRDLDRAHGRNQFASARGLASLYLEGIFGWVPLFQDIHDSLDVLVNRENYGRRFIRASASQVETRVGKKNSSEAPRFVRGVGKRTFKVTESALVTVSNPNLFLANKLGTNPALVAWDIVPWSFVVNMFVNVNQVISNLNAFAGVTVDNASVTKTNYASLDWEGYYKQDCWVQGKIVTQKLPISAMEVHTMKTRTLGTAKFSLTTRLPDANLSLAAMTSALLVQKAKTIGRLVDAII